MIREFVRALGEGRGARGEERSFDAALFEAFGGRSVAGPVVGPILAATYFGWLPAWIWIIAGSILVGGDFTTVTGSADSGAIAHSFLVRLSAGGVRDADFLPRPSAAVYSIKVQRDGKEVEMKITPGSRD